MGSEYDYKQFSHYSQSSRSVQGERPTTTLVLPSNKKTHNSNEKTSITRKPEHINLRKLY